MKLDIKPYYLSMKPGIIRGNLFTMLAGYLIASQGKIDWIVLASATIGTICIIGSGCVFNNILDKAIDQRMLRTKRRPIASGALSIRSAALFGAALFIAGSLVLAVWANLLTAAVGIFGFIMYVLVYGFVKRRSDLGTLVGSMPGAVPPVAGYAAVTGQLDTVALSLFLILVFWQMTHFYAIAIFRKADYKAAGIPVLSITRGNEETRRHMYVFAVLFLIASFFPYVLGAVGVGYAVIVGIVGLYWIFSMIRANAKEYDQWARSTFGASLVVLIGFCAASFVGSVLI